MIFKIRSFALFGILVRSIQRPDSKLTLLLWVTYAKLDLRSAYTNAFGVKMELFSVRVIGAVLHCTY